MLKMLEAIQDHLRIRRDEATAVLEENTNPQDMVAQIEEVIEEGPQPASSIHR